MSFLFPLYLLGAAALAVPILLHLRRRPPKEHIPFSSHLFLEQTPESLTRRTRLERWLLLALRCLALLLLAFAFGRPFLNSLPSLTPAETFTRTVVLVDRSASMHREDLWKRAIDTTKSYLADSEADEVVLAFFDEELDIEAEFASWAPLSPRARAEKFETLAEETQPTPSWLATDLGGAMTRAADLLLAADVSEPATHMEVVVVSDFHNGADQSALQNEAWPEEVTVRSLPVVPEKTGNLSLNLASTPARSNISEAEVYRVRIQNAADSDSAEATLVWQDFPDTAVTTTVAPGSSRIIRSQPRPAAAVRGVLTVSGDAHPFDNDVYVSPVQARPLRVFVTSREELSEDAGTPLFYLRRALQPTPTLTPIVSTGTSLEEADLDSTEVIVAISQWTAETGKRLNEFAESGGLVIALPSSDAPADALASVVDDEGWLLSEADSGDFALLADLDFDHPVLEPFARARILDFTKVRFWKHRVLTLPEPADESADSSTNVLASFDGDSPALIERRVGEGTVFAFLSGWEPKESQLALSSKFVPLLFSIFEHTGFSIRSAPTFYVGETDSAEPGFEEMMTNGVSSLVAINLNPREGNTSPFDPSIVFAEWGIPLVEEDSGTAQIPLSEEQIERLESEEKEENQKLWKWIVFAALLILMFESWLAGRRPKAPASSSIPQTAAT